MAREKEEEKVRNGEHEDFIGDQLRAGEGLGRERPGFLFIGLWDPEAVSPFGLLPFPGGIESCMGLQPHRVALSFCCSFLAALSPAALPLH